MSNKKNLSPKRAAQYAIFEAAQKRKLAAIEAIWVRARSACEECRKGVLRPGAALSPQAVGSVTFADRSQPSAETGKLRCYACGLRAMAGQVVH